MQTEKFQTSSFLGVLRETKCFSTLHKSDQKLVLAPSYPVLYKNTTMVLKLPFSDTQKSSVKFISLNDVVLSFLLQQRLMQQLSGQLF